MWKVNEFKNIIITVHILKQHHIFVVTAQSAQMSVYVFSTGEGTTLQRTPFNNF